MLSDEKFKLKLGTKIDKLGRTKYDRQNEFSAACDIDTRTLRRIIRGEQNATILMLRRIAKALDIPLSELVGIE